MFYLATLSPTVNHRDSPEFVDTAFTLGIGHPAGFPVYNLLAKGFTLTPLGSIAFKVNLFSAWFSCLTLIVLYLAAVRLLSICYAHEEANRFTVPALVPAGVLAFSVPFWFNSVVTEVYSLHAFFTCLILLLLLIWRDRNDLRFLYGAALVYGLSAGNHGTVAFYLPAILILFFCWNEKDPIRNLSAAIFCFLVGLSIFFYLPFRSLAEPSIDWGNPETLREFLYHVTDRKDAETHFRSFRNHLNPLTENSPLLTFWAEVKLFFNGIKNVAGFWFSDITKHLTPVVSVGMIIGAWLCVRKSPPLFIFFLILVGMNATFFTGWGRESFFPSYLSACLLSSLAIFALLNKLRSTRELSGKTQSGSMPESKLNWQRLVIIGLFCLIPWMVLKNFFKIDQSRFYFGETLMRRVLLSLESHAIYFPGVSWFDQFYFNDVMRLRDDVSLIKSWTLLEENPPSQLTRKRFPNLRIPQAGSTRFNVREEGWRYARKLLARNWKDRPIFFSQNFLLFTEFPLVDSLSPFRNLLLKYDPESLFEFGAGAQDAAFMEFKSYLEEEIRKPGINADPGWITKITFILPSFAFFYHEKGWFELERNVLQLTHDFLGHSGPDWQLKMVDNLILDGRVKEARAQWETKLKRFPRLYEARLAEGLLSRAQGDLEDSLKNFAHAVIADPQAIRPYLEASITYFQIGEPSRARAELKIARDKATNLRELNQLRRIRACGNKPGENHVCSLLG